MKTEEYRRLKVELGIVETKLDTGEWFDPNPALSQEPAVLPTYKPGIRKRPVQEGSLAHLNPESTTPYQRKIRAFWARLTPAERAFQIQLRRDNAKAAKRRRNLHTA